MTNPMKRSANPSTPKAPPAPGGQAAALKRVQATRRQLPALADEATWRAFLGLHAGGETSTRAMTEAQLILVHKAMIAAGAPDTSATARAGAARVPRDDRQARKLQAMWITMAQAGVVRDRRDKALLAWCAGELGMPELASLRWVSTVEKSMLIDRLKAYARREGVDVHG
ncbi:MAG: hypothetical protein RLY86_673 [Pseudomonadota bacterium]|jgi:hypothetical protein